MLSMTLYLLVRLKEKSASSRFKYNRMRRRGFSRQELDDLRAGYKSCSPEKIIFKIELLTFYLINSNKSLERSNRFYSAGF